MQSLKKITTFILFFTILNSFSQEYFLKDKAPFDSRIPSPEEFLGYPIGDQHTRHDQIVSYLYKLAEVSDRAEIEVYGYTHERRKYQNPDFSHGPSGIRTPGKSSQQNPPRTR